MKPQPEHELRQHMQELQRFRALLDHAQEAVFVVRAGDGQVVDVNATVSGWLDRDRQDLLQRPIADLLPDAAYAQLAPFVSSHEVVDSVSCTIDTVLNERSTNPRPVEITVQPVTLPDGRFLLLIARDVTEGARALRALREREDRQSKILLAANIGTWNWDLTTNKVRFDRRYYEMAGYTVNEFPHQLVEFQQRVHPDDLDGVMDAARRHLEGTIDRFVVEFRFRTKDCGWIWIMGRGVIVERADDGTPLRFVGTHTDITDRKRAEEEHDKLQAQLHQSQKMESVGRLAGGVAHDFNNMLAVILSRSELLLMGTPKDHSSYEEIEEIIKVAKRSAGLTSQLLAFARRQSIVPEILDLNDAVTRTLSMLRYLIGENVDLIWRPGTDVWPVEMDPGQVDQILANLCVNARDAIAGHGSVVIETRNVDSKATEVGGRAGLLPSSYVELTVRDDGCGMDPDVLANIFEPFFTTKATGQGTGLGLSTVYGIVRQNDGFIEVESTPQAGSTFHIFLPRYQGAVGQHTLEPTSALPEGHGETILLVEDEASLLVTARSMLDKLGYNVLAAASPKEALQQLSNDTEVDLLLTDVVMPGMNGRELAERVCQMQPGIRVLFMSGYAPDAVLETSNLGTGVRYIQKPFTIKAMATSLRWALTSDE